MPAREIKTTLKLEGEQQFKKAMTDASNAIKVLNSEQKLAQAQFEATGNKEEFLTDKTEILRKKIEEQQKAVNAAQDAVNKLKDKGIAPTNKAMQDWTTKLNSAKAYLTRLQGDLNTTERELNEQGDAFDNAGDAAADYSEELQRVSSGVNFQNTITALDAVQNKLDHALSSVVQLGRDILAAELDAAKWADDLITAATKAGIDVETYQSWQYAAQFIDTEVDDIIAAQDKLLKQLTADSEETNKIMNQLGVTTKDSTGHIRNYNDVFWDVIDALGNATDAHGEELDVTRKDQVAQALFGKSYRELLPLIKSGRAAWDEAAAEGRNFATVTEENVKKLGDLDDAHNRFNSRLEYTKNTVLADLAPAFTGVYDSLTKMLDKFNEWTETEEGKASLEGLSEAATGLLGVFTTDDFTGAVNLATKAINGLTSALKWIKENGRLIVGALLGMKAAVTGISVAKTFLEFLELVKSIKWLSVAKGAKALGDAAAGGAGGGAAAGGAGAAAAGAALKSAAAAVAPYAITAAAIVGTAHAVDFAAVERDFGEYNRNVEKMEETLEETIDNHVTGLQDILRAFYEAETYEDPVYGGNDPQKIKDEFRKYANDILNLLPYSDFWDLVRDRVNLDDGLTDEEIERIFGLDTVANGDVWVDLAADVVNGLTRQIEDSEGEGRDAGAGLADALEEGFRDELDIESPSKVMEANGLMITEGLKNGIEAGAADVVAAAAALAAAVQDALAGAQVMGAYGLSMGRALYSTPVYGGAYGGSGRSGGVINNVINVDGRQLASAMTPYVSENMSASLRAQRK